MRVNLKILLLVICSGIFITILLLRTRCGESHAFQHSHLPAQNRDQFQSLQDAPDQDDSYLGEVDHSVRQVHLSGVQEYEEIDCNINGEYGVSCRKEGGEIYVPFSFLHKYFEVYGKLASYDGYERFEWSHSYSKVYYPKGKYDPRGVFMYFENYNVEVRDRVKCISGAEGVPVSTQWESKGYYYPTQIAQFGLSHYSKNLTEPEPRRKLFEDGDEAGLTWTKGSQTSVTPVVDSDTKQWVLEFSAPESVMEPGALLKMDHVLDFVLSLDLKAKGNYSFTVTLQNREKQEVFHLHYVSSDTLIFAEKHNIYHGMGQLTSGWRHLTRDLAVDLQKGLLFQNASKRKIPRSKLKVVSLALHGSGFLDNLTLATSEHRDQFFSAADWFVRHQDSRSGGWANPVQRRFAAGMVELKPGWYSAMGQGHAISVLARAYHLTSRKEFLEAAVKALGPYKVLSSESGVRANFCENVWYEEYPTTPPSFVLNGFIYSLLGLYDLVTVAGTEEARKLFNEGMAALKRMLPLYDTGSGSVYDLRHFTLGVAPNVARWDYHSTHINQLLLLSTIDKDPILSSTSERWIGYMNGKRAAHN